MMVLCALDYEFHILDSAFLVHKPGIKLRSMKTLKNIYDENNQTNFINRVLLPQMATLYGNSTGCFKKQRNVRLDKNGRPTYSNPKPKTIILEKKGRKVLLLRGGNKLWVECPRELLRARNAWKLYLKCKVLKKFKQNNSSSGLKTSKSKIGHF